MLQPLLFAPPLAKALAQLGVITVPAFNRIHEALDFLFHLRQLPLDVKRLTRVVLLPLLLGPSCLLQDGVDPRGLSEHAVAQECV